MKIKYLLAIIVLILLNACKKEQGDTVVSQTKDDKMMIFKNSVEFNTTLSELSTMSIEERKNWAKSRGFESFGVKCEEIYFSSHPENFTSKEEFDALVKKNPEFLKLERWENGEFSLETVLNQNPARYLANMDKMFQIEAEVYKVLEKGTVSTSKAKITKLRFVTDKNYRSYLNDKDLTFSKELSTIEKSTTSVYLGKREDENSASSGNDQTRMWITAGVTMYDNDLGLPFTKNYLTYKVRPYKRGAFFLPWLNVSRTIDLGISAKVGHIIHSSNPPLLFEYVNETFSESKTNYFTNEAYDKLYGNEVYGALYDYNDWGFLWYHCWGDTPSTGVVKIDSF